MAVAAEVSAHPELFDALFGGLTHENPLVRMRVAYAISKVAKGRAELLQPYKDRFLDRLTDPANSHLCRACMLQTLYALALTPDDISLLKDMLRDFMHSESSIVKTFSLELLTEFAEADEALRPEVLPLLWNALENGTPAMRARARKQLAQRRSLRVGGVQSRDDAHFQAFAGARVRRWFAIAGFQLIAAPGGSRAVAEGRIKQNGR